LLLTLIVIPSMYVLMATNKTDEIKPPEPLID
jgi:hypothetical protein